MALVRSENLNGSFLKNIYQLAAFWLLAVSGSSLDPSTQNGTLAAGPKHDLIRIHYKLHKLRETCSIARAISLQFQLICAGCTPKKNSDSLFRQQEFSIIDRSEIGDFSKVGERREPTIPAKLSSFLWQSLSRRYFSHKLSFPFLFWIFLTKGHQTTL